MRKAIAYSSDIIMGRTGEVIKRSYQIELIKQYATENDVEVVAWFEDEMYDEDVLTRSGIQALLAYNKSYDMVLCERVWVLSRSMTVLEPFFKELDRRGVSFECATTMWDCTSQICRHRYSAAYARRPAQVASAPAKTDDAVAADSFFPQRASAPSEPAFEPAGRRSAPEMAPRDMMPAIEKARKVRVAKPAHLYFEHLVLRHRPHTS